MTPEDRDDSVEPVKVRLPELPIFQKYSIALRQEFAEADEFAAVLEKTMTKLRSQRADAIGQRPMPDDVDGKDPNAPAPSSQTEGDADAAFWEMASPGAPIKKSPRKVRPKRRPKPPPAIVRVSSSGKPIIEDGPSAPKPPAK